MKKGADDAKKATDKAGEEAKKNADKAGEDAKKNADKAGDDAKKNAKPAEGPPPAPKEAPKEAAKEAPKAKWDLLESECERVVSRNSGAARVPNFNRLIKQSVDNISSSKLDFLIAKDFYNN